MDIPVGFSESKNILVVDDTKANLDILVEALGDTYNVSVALNGKTALESIDDVLPDLILLDIMMPGMDGFAVCQALKSDVRTQDIPIIFLSAMDQIDAKTRGFRAGAVDYITKPFEILEIRARVRNHLLIGEAKMYLTRQNEILERKVKERTNELQVTQDVTIRSLASLAETRDNETGRHIQRTQYYVRLLSEQLISKRQYSDLLTPRALELLPKSAPLHDVGKVGVPDSILLKPGKLTDEEFEIMKTHTKLGRNAFLQAEADLGSNSFLKHAKEFAYTHHEKWDGTGYPEGRSGLQIPLEGRLMALADVYDALVSRRVYKPPFTHSEAVSTILNDSGTHFDPVVVAAFEIVQEDFRRFALKHADSEEEKETLKA